MTTDRRADHEARRTLRAIATAGNTGVAAAAVPAPVAAALLARGAVRRANGRLVATAAGRAEVAHLPALVCPARPPMLRT